MNSSDYVHFLSPRLGKLWTFRRLHGNTQLDIASKKKTHSPSDGRRQRSERSRQLIIDALLSLIRQGHTEPGAAMVAEAAGVGLRSVFRHFEDMDSLYREMTLKIEAEIQPVISKPFLSTDWKDKLEELVHRRSDVFEEILPLRLSALTRRFQSRYLAEDHDRVVAMERALIAAIVPETIPHRRRLIVCLDLLLCFEAWHRLRKESGMSVDEAVDVQLDMLRRTLAGL
jgi:AcrR family transcriptional regulator